MISLEEHAKINNLIASCNDMINGKFILADYKIANILKNITESNEVYNLIANCMAGFSFEREFSRAQLRSTSNNNKFMLPSEPEKILPFVFCILVNLNNKNINFDSFLQEFYSSENGHNVEYVKFANEIILPFRDIIADYFDIPKNAEEIAKQKSQLLKENQIETKHNKSILNNHENNNYQQSNNETVITNKSLKEEDKMEKDVNNINTSLNANNKNEEFNNYNKENANINNNNNFEISHNNLDEQVKQNNIDNEINSVDNGLSNEKIKNFFIEVKKICEQIQLEIEFDRKTPSLKKEDIIYLTNVIIENCYEHNLKNVIALMTAFDYVIEKIKMLKFLKHELKNLLIELYE